MTNGGGPKASPHLLKRERESLYAVGVSGGLAPQPMRLWIFQGSPVPGLAPLGAFRTSGGAFCGPARSVMAEMISPLGAVLAGFPPLGAVPVPGDSTKALPLLTPPALLTPQGVPGSVVKVHAPFRGTVDSLAWDKPICKGFNHCQRFVFYVGFTHFPGVSCGKGSGNG